MVRLHLQVTSTIVNALGQVSAELWRRAAALVLLGLGCWLGSRWGITGVAVAVALSTALLALAMVVYLNRLTGLTWAEALWPQGPACIASVMMAGGVWAYQRWGAGVWGGQAPALLVASTLVGASVYMLALWLLRPAPVVALVREFCTDLKPAARGVRQ
jgi:hypothetical protein